MSMLPIVQEAVARDRKLKIRYSNRRNRFERAVEPGEPTNTSDRILDPLGLVAKGSTWYLVANTAKGFRTFRVSRIESAILLDAPCERPSNFDLEDHWKSSSEQFLKSWPRFAASLRLHPDAAREMKLWRMVSEISGDVPEDSEGWTTQQVQFEDQHQAVFVILGFGPKVEVLAPATLRDRVAADIAATLSVYQAALERAASNAITIS